MLLQKIQSSVERYVEVLYQVVKVNVEIVDDNYNLIASTEKNRDFGRYESFIYQSVISTGEKRVVRDPGQNPLCRGCPKFSRCEDSFELHTPIKLEGRVIGVICFSCTNEEQKLYMTKNLTTIMDFIEQISDLISLKAGEFLEEERIRSYDRVLATVIDKVEQGILFIDGKGAITRANDAACRSLALDSAEANGGKHTARLREGVNQSEYLLTVDGRDYTTVGELHRLSGGEPACKTVFIFNDINDLHARIAEHTSARENLGLKDIIGSSPAIAKLKERIRRIADSSSTVLITGESGTGKELVARAIHIQSQRNAAPFVAINCAAIPDTLLESELFGYVKGAFTGADPKGKPGKIELANHGMLFLDEIGDMPLYIQAKLLRVLEQREIVRLGSNTPVTVDVRFIAATNKHLDVLIEQRKFREDLYYRLNVIPLHIPALKERREDIPVLTGFFIQKYSQLFQKKIRGVDAGVLRSFSAYAWPGNVRELENTVEYLINMVDDGGVIAPALLPAGFRAEAHGESAGELNLERLEKQAIADALAACGDSVLGKRRAAALLGIGQATLYRKIKRYGLEKG